MQIDNKIFLIELPPGAPEKYQKLWSSENVEIKKKSSVIASINFVVIGLLLFSIGMLLVIGVKYEFLALSWGNFLYALFLNTIGILALVIGAWKSFQEKLKTYVFTNTGVKIQSVKSISIKYEDIRQIYVSGRLVLFLSNRSVANLNIITVDGNRYKIRALTDCKFLVKCLVKRVSEIRKISPRTLLLGEAVERHLIEKGKISAEE